MRTLRHFRAELLERMREAGYSDLRESHMHLFGNIDPGGTRLTELAARANMTRPSMAEIVDELEARGWVERVPDPTDGRAKLVQLTRTGKAGVREALSNMREMEDTYARHIGKERLEDACRALQDLVDALDAEAVGGEPDQSGDASSTASRRQASAGPRK